MQRRYINNVYCGYVISGSPSFQIFFAGGALLVAGAARSVASDGGGMSTMSIVDVISDSPFFWVLFTGGALLVLGHLRFVF
jgi:hypothetical protein